MLIALLIATGVLSTLVHVIDRAANWESDVYAMTLWSSLVQLLLILPLIGLVGLIPWRIAAVLIGVAALTAYARTRWYMALANSGDSLSRLLPLTHISSLFVLVLAAVFLGEQLPPWAMFGGALMIFGAICIAMEQPKATLAEFLAVNVSLLLVLWQAGSRAINNVSYKWIFNEGPYDFFTIYFYLKVFEFAGVALVVASSKAYRARFHLISNPQAFVGARGLQTLSGLMFIFVLDNMQISVAEPISAVGPLYAIAWEWLDRRYNIVHRLGGRDPPLKPVSRLAWTLRLIGIALIIGGFLLLMQREGA